MAQRWAFPHEYKVVSNSELAWTNSLGPDADNRKTATFLQIPSLYAVLWAFAWRDKKNPILFYQAQNLKHP